MRRILLLLCLAASIGVATAQDFEARNKALHEYMAKYASTWSGSRHMFQEYSEQIGTKCPDYYLSKKLNSKKLQGKYVLLNFWATWCTGCRALTVDLDSVFVHNGAGYQDVQLIGVDAHESLVDKGFDADEWWQKHHIGFPTVGGKAADALCDTLKGGHPSLILLDGDGIIRGRWDAWTASTANDARLAIWALHVIPRDGIQADSTTVEKYAAAGKWEEAAYLMLLMPEKLSLSPLRFRIQDHMNPSDAVAYLRELRKANEATRPTEEWGFWEADPAYATAITEIVRYVYSKEDATADVLLAARDACYMLLRTNNAATSEVRLMSTILSYRYGKKLTDNATASVNSIAASPQNYRFDEPMQAKLKEQMQKWGIPEIKEKPYEMSAQSSDLDKEAKENMEGLYQEVSLDIKDNSNVSAVVSFPQKMRAGKNHYIELRVTLPEGWHAYADTEHNRQEGNIATEMKVEMPKGFKLLGKATNSSQEDELTGHFYLRQNFTCPTESKLKGQREFTVKVTLTYQICNGGSCLPPATVETTGTIKMKDATQP